MVATAIVPERCLSEQVQSLNEHMEELAAAEAWDEVAKLLEKRNAMLPHIDESERESALVSAKITTDRIQEMAKTALTSLGSEIATLSRGREATDSYTAQL